MLTYLLTYSLTYLITSLLTYSMQQGPSWEADRFSASNLCNLKVHYRVYNSPQPVHILSQINSIHTPTSHFLKIHLYIILPPTPGSFKWPLSLRLPHQNPVCFSPLPHACYIPRTSHSSGFITRIILLLLLPLKIRT